MKSNNWRKTHNYAGENNKTTSNNLRRIFYYQFYLTLRKYFPEKEKNLSHFFPKSNKQDSTSNRKNKYDHK